MRLPTISIFGLAWPAVFTALLLWMSFFPVNLPWLGFIAFVPWLVSMTWQTGKQRLISSGILGMVFFGIALNWMRVADIRMVATWVMLGTWSALFYLILGWVLGAIYDRHRGLGMTLGFPLVLIPTEWMRAHALEGFPWYFLGHTQHDTLPLLQLAELGGAFLVSLVVALVNGLIADLYLACLSRNSGVKWSTIGIGFKTALVILALACAWIYGTNRLQKTEFIEGTQVAVLQANHPQGLRNFASTEQVRADYNQMQRALFGTGNRPLLIIWPETSYPALVDITGLDEKHWVADPAGAKGPSQLLGASTIIEPKGLTSKQFNSAVLFDPKGFPVDHYDKMHRVPFGEYVPLKEWIPFMNVLAPYDHDYSIARGEKLTRFPLPYSPTPLTFGAAICYESGDAHNFRDLAGGDGKPPVDFFVNQSNDGWFHGTEEHEHHLLLLRFRAVETRRPVIRAVNMGISAWIDSYGRVLRPKESNHPKSSAVGVEVPVLEVNSEFLSTSEWGQYKKNAFVLTGLIPKKGDNLPNIFKLQGSWPGILAFTCVVLLLLGGTKKARVIPDLK